MEGTEKNNILPAGGPFNFALQTYQLSTIGKPKKIEFVARPWCKERQEATIHEASGQIQTQVAERHNLISGTKAI